MAPKAWILVMLACAASCASERPKLRGNGCELNSECDDPLVCRFGRCRIECRDHVDCAVGLDCWIGSDMLGGCQLSDELAPCVLHSDCRRPCEGRTDCQLIACRDGRCGRECDENRDCPVGASCKEGSGGVHTCEVEQGEACLYNSDCPDGTICGHGQVCHVECREDRDCDYPRVCGAINRCVLPDGGSVRP